jgi:mannose-6-phosphate isomerase-like protein (cupin superfamily)
MKLCKILSLALTTALPALAQSTDPTIHTAADLQQREAKLMEAAKASPTGLASATTDDFGSSKIVLVVRVHTGPAERHQLWADQMVISTGTVTLVSGGTMQEEKPNGTAPGETVGSGIQGGKEVVLHAGDIAHVPAGVPHWVKVAPGTTTTYIIFKDK